MGRVGEGVCGRERCGGTGVEAGSKGGAANPGGSCTGIGAGDCTFCETGTGTKETGETGTGAIVTGTICGDGGATKIGGAGGGLNTGGGGLKICGSGSNAAECPDWPSGWHTRTHRSQSTRSIECLAVVLDWPGQRRQESPGHQLLHRHTHRPASRANRGALFIRHALQQMGQP